MALRQRVMRLTTPSMTTSVWPHIDTQMDEVLNEVDQSAGSPPPAAPPAAAAAAAAAAAGAPDHGDDLSSLDIAHALMLPTSQGKVHVGETFTAYLHLLNTSMSERIEDMRVNVEMGVGSTPNAAVTSSRYLLLDTTERGPVGPGEYRDFTIMHHVNEAMTHVLTVVSTYRTASSSEQRTLRRSYRFTVSPLFSISHRTKFISDDLWVECRIENVSSSGALLTNAALTLESPQTPSQPTLGATRIVMDAGNDADKPLAPPLCYVRPKEIHFAVFNVKCDDDTYLRTLPSIGRLLLEWRTSTGGPGVHNEYRIEKMPIQPKPLELRVRECPHTVGVELPFPITLDVINRTGKDMETVIVIMNKDRMGSLHVPGTTTQSIGRVDANSSKRLTLPVIALLPGLHGLSGVSVLDVASQQTFDAEVLCEVLVL
ncbi:unnamed protein product [Vitrella brassicaformis CCMP3155]|uniref:Trafficking protein particle complex subunit 13 n=2 Tax=Vitrella brassicaformis TaxID=1169539 RepID=A0A0G4EMF7_VITBC|nr:unnamed protein product [Vitrella brassicaformis CCMP3155]|eukprot:CEL98186.1 unnamed protein product [Vitrella brassicaformis CCMP3155]